MPHRHGERASVGELGRPAHRACGLGVSHEGFTRAAEVDVEKRREGEIF